jgi:hypothetical protein
LSSALESTFDLTFGLTFDSGLDLTARVALLAVFAADLDMVAFDDVAFEDVALNEADLDEADLEETVSDEVVFAGLVAAFLRTAVLLIAFLLTASAAAVIRRFATFLATARAAPAGCCTGLDIRFATMSEVLPRRRGNRAGPHRHRKPSRNLEPRWRRRDRTTCDRCLARHCLDAPLQPRMKTNQIMPRMTMASPVLITSKANIDGPASACRASVGVSTICPCSLVAMTEALASQVN